MYKITIAICTYNRAKYLDLCLDSITKQTYDLNSFEVLVIDNNSNDNTLDIFNKYADKYSNFNYFLEPQVGLSFARNRAYKTANSNWIAYVDDDSILFNNYVEIALKTITNYNFVCFGGPYISKYLKQKPKWIKDDFGSNKFLLNSITRIFEDNIICGGNMIFNKLVLYKIGGFSFDLGMKAKEIGYGEENLVQKIILKKNLPIGFNPELKIYHIVLPHKYKLSWHLSAIYAHGRDRAKIDNLNIKKKTLIYFLIKNVIKSIISIPTLLFRLKRKDYYWQNFILDFSHSIFYTLGRIKAK